MFNEVIGIRTNTWTDREEEMHHQLKKVFSPDQIFVIVDETKGEVNVPEEIQKIAWDQEFMTQQGLLDYDHFNMGIGWTCGDYFYYAFYQKVLADYYWLIEPDVGLTFDSWKHDFFDQFQGVEAGALLGNFRLLPKEDYWYESARLIGEQTYGCSFPLNRLSYQAIHRCFLERQRLSLLFKENDCRSNTHNPLGVHFPNDEALVAATLIREGFVVKDFVEVLPDTFDFFGYHHVFEAPISGQLRPANQVIHPVRSATLVAQKLANAIIGDLKKYKNLSRVTVNPEDAQFIAEQVGDLVAQYISPNLAKDSAFTLDFSDLKNLVRQATQTSHRHYFWTYRNHVFVVEVVVEGEHLVTEFLLEDGMVSCFSFGRTLPDWGRDIFHSHYPEMEMQGHKIKQFSLPFVNITDLKPFIEDALNNFFAIL